jgi:epoxyqueuosine reductase
MAYLTSQVERRATSAPRFRGPGPSSRWRLQYDTPHPYSSRRAAPAGWIARYAWGDDYHDVLKALLRPPGGALAAEVGPFLSARVRGHGADRGASLRGGRGIGAWGKNTCLLHPEHGSGSSSARP